MAQKKLTLAERFANAIPQKIQNTWDDLVNAVSDNKKKAAGIAAVSVLAAVPAFAVISQANAFLPPGAEPDNCCSIVTPEPEPEPEPEPTRPPSEPSEDRDPPPLPTSYSCAVALSGSYFDASGQHMNTPTFVLVEHSGSGVRLIDVQPTGISAPVPAPQDVYGKSLIFNARNVAGFAQDAVVLNLYGVPSANRIPALKTTLTSTTNDYRQTVHPVLGVTVDSWALACPTNLFNDTGHRRTVDRALKPDDG